MKPILFQGNQHTDKRGTIAFVNDCKLNDVKRFYTIEHPDTTIVRAWQGHQKEAKWFYVLQGRFQVVACSAR